MKKLSGGIDWHGHNSVVVELISHTYHPHFATAHWRD